MTDARRAQSGWARARSACRRSTPNASSSRSTRTVVTSRRSGATTKRSTVASLQTAASTRCSRVLSSPRRSLVRAHTVASSLAPTTRTSKCARQLLLFDLCRLTTSAGLVVHDDDAAARAARPSRPHLRHDRVARRSPDRCPSLARSFVLCLFDSSVSFRQVGAEDGVIRVWSLLDYAPIAGTGRSFLFLFL